MIPQPKSFFYDPSTSVGTGPSLFTDEAITGLNIAAGRPYTGPITFGGPITHTNDPMVDPIFNEGAGGFTNPGAHGDISLPLPLAPPIGGTAPYNPNNESLPLPVAPPIGAQWFGGSSQVSPNDPFIGSIGNAVPFTLPIAPSMTVTAVQSQPGAPPPGSGSVDTGLLASLLTSIGGGGSLGSVADPGSGVSTGISTAPGIMPPAPPPASQATSAPATSGTPWVLILIVLAIGGGAWWYFSQKPHAIGPPAHE